MPAKTLAEMIESLTPEQQATVREFIIFITQQNKPASSLFAAAVDEFIEQHPELLRHLAQ